MITGKLTHHMEKSKNLTPPHTTYKSKLQWNLKVNGRSMWVTEEKIIFVTLGEEGFLNKSKCINPFKNKGFS